MYIYVCICICTSTLFEILFLYRLLQRAEQRYLCYTPGHYQLSALYIVLCIGQSRLPKMALVVKNPPASTGDIKQQVQSEKIPQRSAWQPTLVFLLGESHGKRSLMGCKESDTTEAAEQAQANPSLQFLSLPPNFWQPCLFSTSVALFLSCR